MNLQPTKHEIELMREGLALAALGRGSVEPNPMVGCIIAKGGQVIGRGYHQKFGQSHAEPNALASCTQDPHGATAIVTLEPCCHHRKKTPPCVPALIAAGIARVIVGHIDPNPQVSGQGIAQLRAAGIEVITGVLETQCRQLNAPFFALTQFRRPYVTLKWAQSADGLMGGTGNTPRRLSSPESSRLVHMLRTRCDAIAVSADTVIADDPLLTPRNVPILRIPLRIILDTHLRTPPTARLLTTANEIPTTIFAAVPEPQISAFKSRIQNPESRIPDLKSEISNLQFHPTPLSSGHLDLRFILHELGQRGITHLLIEPGPRLAQAFLAQNLADRLWIVHSPKALNEPNAPLAPAAPWSATAQRQLGPDTLAEHLNPTSPAFFAPSPSPELALGL